MPIMIPKSKLSATSGPAPHPSNPKKFLLFPSIQITQKIANITHLPTARPLFHPPNCASHATMPHIHLEGPHTAFSQNSHSQRANAIAQCRHMIQTLNPSFANHTPCRGKKNKSSPVKHITRINLSMNNNPN